MNTSAVAAFIAAWNTDGEGERLDLLRSCCAPDAVFVSPQGAIEGISALSDAIAAFRRASPRAVVVAGPAYAHHGFARLRWETRWNDGREPLCGDDFMELDTVGRITRVVSFDGAAEEPAPYKAD